MSGLRMGEYVVFTARNAKAKSWLVKEIRSEALPMQILAMMSCRQCVDSARGQTIGVVELAGLCTSHYMMDGTQMPRAG